MPSRSASAGITLDVKGCKARYGVAYLRSVCGQAGIGLQETPPDEDVLAVDCEVSFPEANVRVQVKCTSKWNIRGSSLTYPVEAGWVRKWDMCAVPVYFVVVIVPPDHPSTWLQHHEEGTFHSTAAFWARLIPGHTGHSVPVPKDQRLSMETIEIWHRDLRAAFTQRDS